MERKDVEARFKWKTQDIFTDDEHWEREFEAVENTYADYDFSAYENKFDDKQTLLDFFRVVQDFSRRAEKLYL
jgi:oligoendopeptidase F